jgi:hypothetical protein
VRANGVHNARRINASLPGLLDQLNRLAANHILGTQKRAVLCVSLSNPAQSAGDSSPNHTAGSLQWSRLTKAATRSTVACDPPSKMSFDIFDTQFHYEVDVQRENN